LYAASTSDAIAKPPWRVKRVSYSKVKMISMSQSTLNVQQEQQIAQPARTKSQYACLYTHHKTQKRKTWQDGRLEVKGNRVELYAACPKLGAGDPILDVVEITNTSIPLENQLSSIIETEKFLIDIQGPWQSHNPINSLHHQTQSTQQQASQPLISNGMKKVLGTKFRKPQSHGPPKLPLQSSSNASTISRKRPLQPGELVRQYYGNIAQSQSSPELPSTYRQFQSHPRSDLARTFPPQTTTSREPIEPMTNFPGRAAETCENPFQQQPEIMTMTMMSQNSHRTESPPTQAMASSSTTSITRTMFLRPDNGFQASQFYGEEEEEEDKEEGLPDVFRLASSQPSEQVSCRKPLAETNTTDDGNDCRLSTSQLLDLFGASAPSKENAIVDDFVLPPNDDSNDES
jgi:hypothetical protein